MFEDESFRGAGMGNDTEGWREEKMERNGKEMDRAAPREDTVYAATPNTHTRTLTVTLPQCDL